MTAGIDQSSEANFLDTLRGEKLISGTEHWNQVWNLHI
jgi:hypothetical protein